MDINIHTHGHYFRFLFELQESGRTNMFGAASYLIQRFGLDRNEAKEILLYWMDNYDTLARQMGID